MGILGVNNMNMNMNMNMAAGVSSDGTLTHVRFNTADYRKLVQVLGTPPLVAPLPEYPERWDADLRSYVYLHEFVRTNATWFVTLSASAVAGLPPTSASMAPQITAVLDRAADRDDRFAEIMHQHDADGAISYYLGMLMVDPGRHPYTYLLVRAARRIGEMVAMCLKEEFRCPRPSQVCPAIVPMIDPPATPSFPSGHALQARLITRCLENVRHARPPANVPAPSAPPTATPLRYLAYRIAENRVIAGLHFERDNEAGFAIADRLFLMLTPNLTSAAAPNVPDPAVVPAGATCFETLLLAARAEGKPPSSPTPGRCNQT
jgi:hypothetical protein